MNEIKLFIKHDDDIRDTAEIWIEAIVDGTPQNFILDTGCATTSLFYNDFSSKYSATDTREYSSAFGKSVYDSILIESIYAGPIAKTKMKIARTRKGGNDKNLFGMDLLNDLALHLSLSSNSLTVLKEFIPDLTLHDLFLDDGSIPFIDIFCGTTKAKAVWDTGAGITIVDKAFLEGHKDMFKHVGSTKGTDSSGSSFETPIYLMKSMEIAGYVFPEHRVVPLNLTHLGPKSGRGMDFILGYSTLKHAHWMLDFKNKKWAITKVLF